MDITFAEHHPRYCASNLTVVFSASVAGREVDCAITVEALEDHFDVRSIDESGWLAAFERARGTIENCARRHLSIDPLRPVLLRSGHFQADPAAHGTATPRGSQAAPLVLQNLPKL